MIEETLAASQAVVGVQDRSPRIRSAASFRHTTHGGNRVTRSGDCEMNSANSGVSEPLFSRSVALSTRCAIQLLRVGRERQGTAAVEFAMVFPLLLLLVFGAIDVGRALTVQHNLVEAARAGCRLYAITEEVTEAEARAAVDQIMADADLHGYATELDPYPSNSIEHLKPVTVSVSIPYDNVSWLPSWFLSGKTLTGTCIMPGDTGEIGGGDNN